MRTLGIIGGMGVQATARFYTMLANMQTVRAEQEYLDVLMYSMSSIPDRTAFITGESDESPLGALQHAAKVLVEAGVSCIVMPCISAHFFYEDLVQGVPVPFINMMDETARFVQGCGYSKVGLLATDGTLHGQFFHKALAMRGIDVVVPEVEAQAVLSELIYKLKCGEIPANALDELSTGLHNMGAEAIILGCTELGLLEKSTKYVYIESMEVLARAALDRM